MTEVYPQTLPSVDSNSAWHSSYEYRFQSEDSTYVYYGLFQLSSQVLISGTANLIKVNKSTNIWEDYGSSSPNTVTEQQDGTVILYNDTTVLYKFTKPVEASWISTDGHDETLDDAEGNLVNYPSFTEMNVSVSALSPFGSDYIYYLLKDFVVLDSRVISDESERNYTFDYGTEQSSQYGEWQLYVAHVPSSATKVLHILNIPVPTIVRRRGSLNFW